MIFQSKRFKLKQTKKRSKPAQTSLKPCSRSAYDSALCAPSGEWLKLHKDRQTKNAQVDCKICSLQTTGILRAISAQSSLSSRHNFRPGSRGSSLPVSNWHSLVNNRSEGANGILLPDSPRAPQLPCRQAEDQTCKCSAEE